MIPFIKSSNSKFLPISIIVFIIFGCANTKSKEQKSPLMLLSHSYIYAVNGQYNQAIKYNNEAIKINPYFAEAYNNRACIYIEMGFFDKAISDCNKAIELNPKIARFYVSRGSAYGAKKEYEIAIINFALFLFLFETVQNYPV